MTSSAEVEGRKRTSVFTFVVLVSAGLLMLCPAALSAQQKPARGQVIVPPTSVVRPLDRGKRAHTNYLIFLPAKGKPNPPTGPTGETPGSLACIYQTAASLSSWPDCPISTATSLPNGGSGVIAIVDAYDYPTAGIDFGVFSQQFGLPTGDNCNGSKPCFTKVYATGSQPKTNGGWAQEAALDIEWAHAMAPYAQIVLVEAKTNSNTDLLQAVQVANNEVLCGQRTTCTAGASGQGEVSMSWGGSEFSVETDYDGYFTSNNITYFASSGDRGGAVIWPSASPNVVSAGGTTIHRDSDGNFTGETAWSGSGGGPSRFEERPTYQNVIAAIVGGSRGTPDFSFDANPASGVSVYDSTRYQGLRGWLVFGGTSVSAPSLAGIVNLAGHFNSDNDEQNLIYTTYGTSTGNCKYGNAFNDITSGSAGRYDAVAGWDFVTGVGSDIGYSCGK